MFAAGVVGRRRRSRGVRDGVFRFGRRGRIGARLGLGDAFALDLDLAFAFTLAALDFLAVTKRWRRGLFVVHRLSFLAAQIVRSHHRRLTVVRRVLVPVRHHLVRVRADVVKSRVRLPEIRRWVHRGYRGVIDLHRSVRRSRARVRRRATAPGRDGFPRAAIAAIERFSGHGWRHQSSVMRHGRVNEHSTDAHIVDQSRGVTAGFHGTAKVNHTIGRALGRLRIRLNLNPRVRLLLNVLDVISAPTDDHPDFRVRNRHRRRRRSLPRGRWRTSRRARHTATVEIRRRIVESRIRVVRQFFPRPLTRDDVRRHHRGFRDLQPLKQRPDRALTDLPIAIIRGCDQSLNHRRRLPAPLRRSFDFHASPRPIPRISRDRYPRPRAILYESNVSSVASDHQSNLVVRNVQNFHVRLFVLVHFRAQIDNFASLRRARARRVQTHRARYVTRHVCAVRGRHRVIARDGDRHRRSRHRSRRRPASRASPAAAALAMSPTQNFHISRLRVRRWRRWQRRLRLRLNRCRRHRARALAIARRRRLRRKI